MTSRKLLQLQNQINFECYEIARNAGLLSGTIAGPIYDGVPNEGAYLQSSPKVMWILQEPHDSGCPKGEAMGNWSVPKDMLRIEEYDIGNRTHAAIAKVMYSFRENVDYDDVDVRYRADEGFALEVMGVLSSTAWINISKMPCMNGTRANLSSIRKNYERYWKPIVRRQVVDVFKPDIVVVAGTHWDYLSEDLLPDGEALECYPNMVDPWIGTDGRQYLWVDHPTARKPRCFGTWVRALRDAQNRVKNRRCD